MHIVNGSPQPLEGFCRILGTGRLTDNKVAQVAFEISSEGPGANDVLAGLVARPAGSNWYYIKLVPCSQAEVLHHAESSKLANNAARDLMGVGTWGKSVDHGEMDSHYNGEKSE